MIAILDLARELLGHPKPRHDQYRLLRPRFRLTCDAYDWLRAKETVDGGFRWRNAEARLTALHAWIDLRETHRVAWVERGGSER